MGIATALDPAVPEGERALDPMSGMDQRLGSRYVLKERLGRGAMGTVWRAANTDSNQDVAVKVLSEELSDEPEMVTRFIQERNTLIGVRHPNLVRIHDLVVEDGKLGIVMDLVPGPDLHRYLVEHGVLTLAEAAVIGRGVADALAAIHAAGIIHRDLKPANILLDLSGPQPQPKLVDFGIARMLAGSRLTARSSVVGTPQYLSPEAISGAEPSPSLDIYAFGIALYELFTGAPPFHSDQLLQVLNQHMYQEPPWPTSIPPQILPLLQAMLAKNPQARPNAADLARAMDALLAATSQAGAWQVPAIPAPSLSPASQPGAPISARPADYGVLPAPDSPLPPQPGPHSPLPLPQGPQSPLPPGPPSLVPQVQGYPSYPPQGPGTPLPGGYGGPAASPVPGPSPSGFFYPGREMLGGQDEAGEVFTPNPPPFTDDMFAVKKPQRDWRRIGLVGGGTLAVLAVGGLIFALTGSGGSPTPRPSASSVTHTTAAAITPCPVEAAVNVSPAARWMLAGSPADCVSAPADSNALTVSNGAGWVTSAPRGQVLSVSGGSALATVPNTGIVNTADSFTVSIWVNLDSYNPKEYSTVLALQGKAVTAFTLEYNPGWGGWAFNHTTSYGKNAAWVAAAGKTAPQTNTWTHLVGVYDASAHTATLYVDGDEVAQQTGVVGWDGNYQIALGGETDNNGATFDAMSGKLSDLQIFTAALPPQQVAAIP